MMGKISIQWPSFFFFITCSTIVCGEPHNQPVVPDFQAVHSPLYLIEQFQIFGTAMAVPRCGLQIVHMCRSFCIRLTTGFARVPPASG